MINEALSWPKGTYESQKRHDVTPRVPNPPEVYFLKPGKEAKSGRKKINPNDMLPQTGYFSDKKYGSFRGMWQPITEISILDEEIFHDVLVLVYRNAFLLDHIEESGRLRYGPRREILEHIQTMNKKVQKMLPCGLIEFLCFLDVLGWNEDVKYHVEDDKVTFSGKYKPPVGRINNMLTCIRVTYETSKFVHHVLENSGKRDAIDFGRILTPMQAFINGRGVAPASDKDLLDWLGPTVHK